MAALDGVIQLGKGRSIQISKGMHRLLLKETWLQQQLLSDSLIDEFKYC
jgi:hypothetical protein